DRNLSWFRRCQVGVFHRSAGSYIKASCYRKRALRSVLGASDQLSNPDVASDPICGEVGAWLTILRRALRFTSERSCRHRCWPRNRRSSLPPALRKETKKLGR